MATRKYPPDIVNRVLLGEAANQGPAGMLFVAEVMRNRALAGNKTLQQVATAPYQFSASARPDLDKFYQQQPEAVRQMAAHILSQIQAPDYQPQYPGITHYVTQSLYDRRNEPGVAPWIRKMRPVAKVGDHIGLAP